MLVVGRRTMAWPAESRAVGLLYQALVSEPPPGCPRSHEVTLLNPDVRRLMVSDPRVKALVHDIFEPGRARLPT